MEHGSYKSFFEAAAIGDLELVRGYVRTGVDVNFIHPEFQSTALVVSILGSHEDVALFLLEQGADSSQLSPLDELTPIEAAEKMELESVKTKLIDLTND
ncbi:MAG: hypothetical protein WAS05_03020 [Candidatus Nanopelagicales bacterium]